MHLQLQMKIVNISWESRVWKFCFCNSKELFLQWCTMLYCSNIDRRDTGLLTQQQFRAAIEGRFDLNMSDADFDLLLTKVPLDHDGMVRYVEFMSKFDTT